MKAPIALALLMISALPLRLEAAPLLAPEHRVTSAYALPEDTELTVIAFGSCINQHAPQPIWKRILEQKPELFILTGDNVYSDKDAEGRRITEPTLETMAAAYKKQGQHSDFAAAKAQLPFLATWDDHDYGLDDIGEEFSLKAESKALFAEFFQLPEDHPLRDHEGIYQAVTFGPPQRRVQIILLDTRWFRSPLLRGATGDGYQPDSDPAKTLLGEEQWAWLAEELEKPADLRLIVSSIQVLTDGHIRERWGNLPLERQRLLALIEQSGAQNTILLSGDRHKAAIYFKDLENGQRLWEATSSSINFPLSWISRENDPTQLGYHYTGENFGLITIDWEAKIAYLAIHDQAGGIQHQFQISLDPEARPSAQEG